MATTFTYGQDCLKTISTEHKSGYQNKKLELTCPSHEVTIQTVKAEHCDLDINNGADTDIAVKIVVNHLPTDASLDVH
ncbi:MAG TPA: hypothetical protein VKA27_12500 [Sunxiuqinia sp.]|nr:hypothetical protein [Sunxiuqinia sp.]